MLVCLIAATFGVGSLFLEGFVPASAIVFIWWTWWLGDATGILTVGSLLLVWSRKPPFAREPGRLAEAVFLVVLLFAMALSIFGIVSPFVTLPPPLAYLTIPFLVWATFRFGLHGAATTLFLVSAVAVAGTAQGTGPFAQPTVPASLLLLQIFMGVIAVTALVMAAVLSERRGAETALSELNATLERRVAERTQAFQESERALKEKSQVLEAVLESMGDAVLVTDLNGNLLLQNRAFHLLHATPTDPGPTAQWSRAYGVPARRHAVVSERPAPPDPALQGKMTDDVELEIVNEQHPGGVPVSVTGRPLRGPEGVSGG